MSITAKRTWEYLVQDFLDIRCSLKESEQQFLLDFLRDKNIKADAIKAHSAFSVNEHLVVVLDEPDSKKRLIYHPLKKTGG